MSYRQAASRAVPRRERLATMIVFRNAAGPGPLVALTAGVAAVATLAAPTANATCLSFFGIGSGGQCTSSATSIAVAFGTDAEAHAEACSVSRSPWATRPRR